MKLTKMHLSALAVAMTVTGTSNMVMAENVKTQNSAIVTDKITQDTIQDVTSATNGVTQDLAVSSDGKNAISERTVTAMDGSQVTLSGNNAVVNDTSLTKKTDPISDNMDEVTEVNEEVNTSEESKDTSEESKEDKKKDGDHEEEDGKEDNENKENKIPQDELIAQASIDEVAAAESVFAMVGESQIADLSIDRLVSENGIILYELSGSFIDGAYLEAQVDADTGEVVSLRYDLLPENDNETQEEND